MKELLEKIKITIYNCRWDKYVGFIDGWIPRLAFSVPLIGYLILFNDSVNNLLIFDSLTNNSSTFFFTGSQRLRLVYFGLISLGVSNLIYHCNKPKLFRFGTNFVDYSRTCFETFTLIHYMDIDYKDNSNEHMTMSGKYNMSNWNSFAETAENSWEEAKLKHGDLLRNMLEENWFQGTSQRKFILISCLLISLAGYILLLTPSFDLFIQVVKSS